MRRTRALAATASIGVAAAIGTVASRRALPEAAGQEQPAPARRSPEPVLEGHFATAVACARCHSSAPRATALRDASGASVAPFDLWRSSMMANSARDPLWRAQVAAEVAGLSSEARGEVVAECLRCHAPMASHEARLRGEPAIGLEVLDDPGPRGALARDGASCTACHQVRDEGLGTKATFSGQLPIGEDRAIYGPHQHPVGGPMQRFTSFAPVYGPHMTRSVLCATCHTLHLDLPGAPHTEPGPGGGEAGAASEPRGPGRGAPAGRQIVEQSPFLEWRASAWNDDGPFPSAEARSCQACHVPVTDGAGVALETRIARNPAGGDFPFVQPRWPVGRHVFVGGNVLVPAILRDNAAELKVEAPREAFDATLALAREQLERRTATVRLEGVTRAASTEGGGPALRARVVVTNLAGHKLPTGIPVRRVWLRVRVRDRAGRVVFASGEHDAEGRILDASGGVRAEERPGGPTYPHRDVIAGPSDVQVWEKVLADAEGRPTFRLRKAAGHLKDDRLLPRGWDASHPDAAETAPFGVDGDASFVGGGDAVRLELPLAPGVEASRIEVAVLFQPLGARWAAELLQVDAPEVARFARFYARADRGPVVVAACEAPLP